MPAVIPLVAAVIPAIAGGMQASKNKKAANKAGKKQEAADQAALDLQRDYLDTNKERYNEWSAQFKPVLEDLKNDTYALGRPDYAKVSADVGGAFDTARDIGMRNQERMGIRPGEGAQGAADTAYGLGRATEMVGARQRERKGAAAARTQGLANLYQMGEGLRSSAMSAEGQGVQGVAGQYGVQADRAGQAANLHGQAAGANTAAALGAIGNIAGSFGGGFGGFGAQTAQVPNSPSYGMPGSPGSGAFGTTDWGI